MTKSFHQMNNIFRNVIFTLLFITLGLSVGRAAASSDRVLEATRLYRQVTIAGTTFCLGPASWRADQVDSGYYEQWVASEWIDTGKGTLNNRPYTLNYGISASCINLDGATLTSGDIFLPTGLYGGFITIMTSGEWNHEMHEAGVRSFPNVWTITGEF